MTPRLLQSARRLWNLLRPLDRAALLSGAVLAALLIAVIAGGDRVGVSVETVYPLGLARETVQVTFLFGETMDRSSVVDRFTSDPRVEGEISWRGNRMIFQPSYNLSPGTKYRFAVSQGAQARSGRRTLEDHEVTFTVSESILLYLRPDEDGIANMWAVDPADPSTATQLTRSSGGVGDLEPGPDGKTIAFTEREEPTGALALKLFDFDTGEVSVLTDSENTGASGPAWHPDGIIIAYERIDRVENISGVIPVPRIWAVDLFTNPPTQRRLIANRELVGYSPKWSPDGRRITLGTNSPSTSGLGVLVYDFIAADFDFHETVRNTLHAFSNDGSRLIFPVVEPHSGRVQTKLQVVDLETGGARTLDLLSEPAQDRFVSWSPDDRTIALVRRYPDIENVPGHQPYLLDTGSLELEPAGLSANGDANTVNWSPSGLQLAIWRTVRWADDGATLSDPIDEVWLYETGAGEMRLLATNATAPKWLP